MLKQGLFHRLPWASERESWPNRGGNEFRQKMGRLQPKMGASELVLRDEDDDNIDGSGMAGTVSQPRRLV